MSTLCFQPAIDFPYDCRQIAAAYCENWPPTFGRQFLKTDTFRRLTLPLGSRATNAAFNLENLSPRLY